MKKNGKKTVLVHGCFDILHYGHLDLFVKAKSFGDVLIVGIDHDENVRINKGPNRPYNNHEARMQFMSHLEIIDYVFMVPPYDDPENRKPFFEKLYKKISPDILASAISTAIYDERKKNESRELGIEFVGIESSGETSTTKILQAFGLE